MLGDNMLYSSVSPMVEATASDITHTRASRLILVAFKPPYYSKHCAELVFLFSAIQFNLVAKNRKGVTVSISMVCWINVN